MNTASDVAADMHAECQVISPDIFPSTNLARKARKSRQFYYKPWKKLLLCSLLYVFPKYANFLWHRYICHIWETLHVCMITCRQCNYYKHAVVTHLWVNIVEEISLQFPDKHLNDKVYHNDCHWNYQVYHNCHISTCSALIYLYNLSSISVRPFWTTWNNQFSILEL